MTLLALLICVGLQWYLGIGDKDLLHDGITRYFARLDQWFERQAWWHSVLGLLATLVPIGLLVGILDWLIYNILGITGHFIFATVVLFFCIQSGSFKTRLVDYLSALRSQQVALAYQYSETFLGGQKPQTEETMVREMSRHLFSRSFHRFFCVVFWFVVFGPVGAVLYVVLHRTTKLVPEDSGFGRMAAHLNFLVEWIPSRLVGLTFALVGRFRETLTYWSSAAFSKAESHPSFLYNIGLIALAIPPNTVALVDAAENERVIRLIEDAAIIWLVAIALFTLGTLLA